MINNYRAWNKKDKKMYYAEFGKHCFITNTEWWAIGDPDTENYVATSGNSELMLCTGAKDKNGVLIYEGDIIRDGDGKLYRIPFFREIPISERNFSYLKKDDKEVVGHIYEGR